MQICTETQEIIRIKLAFLTTGDEKNLRQEYEHLRHSIWSRGQIGWLVHSIIVSATLIVVLESWEYKEKFMQQIPILEIPMGVIFPVIAIIGVLFSVYLQFTDLKLNDSMFQRMHEIEKLLGMLGPSELFETKIKPVLWFKMRRFAWFVLFVSLTIAYFLVLISWFIA